MLAHVKSATAPAYRKSTQTVWKSQARPVKAWRVGEEPCLTDLMADETMQRLMARDRVDPDGLLALVRSVRQRLAMAE
jgi:hypothetical protein